jgi:hypothetical protein
MSKTNFGPAIIVVIGVPALLILIVLYVGFSI